MGGQVDGQSKDFNLPQTNAQPSGEMWGQLNNQIDSTRGKNFNGISDMFTAVNELNKPTTMDNTGLDSQKVNLDQSFQQQKMMPGQEM